MVIDVLSVNREFELEWNEEAKASGEDVLNKRSWGKGRQLVLVPGIFMIPDSCQAPYSLVEILGDPCGTTPLYTYRSCDNEQYV